MFIPRIPRPLRILSALTLLVVVSIVALQPAPTAEAGDPVLVARAYLEDRLAARAATVGPHDFTVIESRDSLAARHVHFQQTLNGVPVYAAYLSVSLDKDADRVSLVTGRDFPNVRVKSDGSRVTEAKATSIARKAVGARGDLWGAVTADLVYFTVDGIGAVRAWQVVVPAVDPLGKWLVIVSAADGAVLHTDNRVVFDHPATGQVFDPNPVVSSGGAVPPPTHCDDAASEADLTGEYVSRELPDVNASQGQLIGPYVDLTAPGIGGAYKPAGQANELSHVYVYPCDDDRFEEVVIYYHVDAVQRLVQSLGFTGVSSIAAFPLDAHAHWWDGCNAFYAGQGIHFGDGECGLDVDFAEDPDVIVHEYGHAMQDDQIAGGNPFLPEGAGMGEGFSDFLAAAVFGDPCMFEWVSALVNQNAGIVCTLTPKGSTRDLVNKAHYPEGLHADEHVTGLIWGGALWDLVQDFGGDEAARMQVLTLVLQSHFYLNSTATFADGAAALQQADQDLNGGANLTVINNVLARRGIIPVASPGSDKDADGCTNGQEVTADPQSGGLRDPLDFWDFFDTPDPALPPGPPNHQRDKMVDLFNDIFRVALRFGANDTGPGDFDRNSDPLSGPNALVPPSNARENYHPAFDRGPPTDANGIIIGQPDGNIDLFNDIFGVANQFGHNCT